MYYIPDVSRLTDVYKGIIIIIILSPAAFPSLCTMVVLQWEPQIVAVAVMYLAGRLSKFDIQEWTSKQSSRRWWEQFVHDVPVEVLEGSGNTVTLFIICMLYKIF